MLGAMTEPTPTRLRRPANWAIEHRWDSHKTPLPLRPIYEAKTYDETAFDFSRALRAICSDIAFRCPTFSHIDTTRMLFSFTPSRNRSRFGLQARVTPMRFRDGALTRRLRGILFGVQRYYIDGREILYLVTFCLPRFLDQTYEEKMTTIFHELYHISPQFNGDLRRHPGRYAMHSHSARDYDRQMLDLARHYLLGHPQPEVFDFLRYRGAELWKRHGGVQGVVVPRPKLVPISW